MKKWSPKNSDNEDGTETASEYSEHQESENTDLEPEGNSDVPYSEETASPAILLKVKGPCYYCNRENVYQTTKMFIRFVRNVHIEFLLIVDTRQMDLFGALTVTQ